MKVLLDSNVILDVALERQPFFGNSETVVLFVEAGQIEGYICASSFSDLYYIIRKDKGRNLALEFLREIVTFCRVATLDSTAINMALNLNFRDFEDAIQYSAAVLNHLDAIITRNPRDFPVATPRIITPEELIQELTNTP
ncbi:type II toxin-antitoxin system VapC family toxin [Nostoc sp. 'Peltigera membranacea cyanobiont' N6]|uniref:type II toxin-antitoxin system VapC family toxin n=1 Tax=Nostoc sp. 'Peltigera membranacea cyanobiont' N6 TaxID=1261031 RepID=UPI000CF3402F|nr:PIN domain-containing protein [Nostoc sp. 'Peltigera membranacea cyanobiont' N6]AVH62798.1 PIN domain protein [Nostoc sp. 'Peltigera membranacea cyanobiont' N6]